MSDFSSGLAKFNQKLNATNVRIYLGSTAEIERSIKVGSELTGSPGQPVQTGFLRNSYETTFPEYMVSQVATSTNYATEIEDNTRGAKLRSKVGGFHSVKKTRLAWKRIVDFVTRREVGRA